MGFVEDVEKILTAGVATEVQTLLFSATLPTWVKEITRRFLRPNHQTIDLVGKEKMKVGMHACMHACLPACLSAWKTGAVACGGYNLFHINLASVLHTKVACNSWLQPQRRKSRTTCLLEAAFGNAASVAWQAIAVTFCTLLPCMPAQVSSTIQAWQQQALVVVPLLPESPSLYLI